MLFSSVPFMYYFFPLVAILYFAVPAKFIKVRNAILFLFSLVFYAWGEKHLVILFILSILVGYGLGLLIEKFRGNVWSKVFLIIAVLYSLGMLGYFKYTDFFLDNMNQVFKTMIPLPHIALPIGISFYTFQILSYDIDVYRGDVPANRNPIDFGAYVSFFPQLIAGPIVRYSDIAAQLKERDHSLEKIALGIRRFMVGLGKKILIANLMGQVVDIFQASTQQSVLFAWISAIAYMMQIYFDFSGYSDMAIGLGKIFGFDFIENFNHPYESTSVTEFWRRWHMSLGSWFRDYVYIPLGGNRRGMARQLFNILVVWMLTGFWHGASWNFILWGLLYAILLTFEKMVLGKFLKKHRIFGHVYLLLAVLFGFVLFNAVGDLSLCTRDIANMFGLSGLPFCTPETLYYLRSFGVIFIVAFIGATSLPMNLYHKLEAQPKAQKVLAIVEPLLLVLLLAVVTAYLVGGSFNPFLYFRF